MEVASDGVRVWFVYNIICFLVIKCKTSIHLISVKTIYRLHLLTNSGPTYSYNLYCYYLFRMSFGSGFLSTDILFFHCSATLSTSGYEELCKSRKEENNRCLVELNKDFVD